MLAFSGSFIARSGEKTSVKSEYSEGILVGAWSYCIEAILAAREKFIVISEVGSEIANTYAMKASFVKSKTKDPNFFQSMTYTLLGVEKISAVV